MTFEQVMPRLLVTIACSGIAAGAPEAQMQTTPSRDRPVVIAHRGFSAAAPEHTFAAWDLALDAGADYLEQDLQMTADGVLVVLHDDTLDRTARGEGCTGPVRERTLAQLAGCDVGSWFNERWPDRARPEFVGLPIPTFREVLERYAGRARFYVETKNPSEAPGMEQALVALLDEFGLLSSGDGPPRVIMQSFSPESLLTLGQIAPGLPRVQLLSDEYDAARTLELLPRIAFFAQGIGPWHGNVSAELIEAAAARGLLVHPYTVNEPERMAQLVSLGVDGMFTDRPDELRRLVDSSP